MKIKNRLLFNRFRNFMLSLNKKDRIAVIHHTDPDGICSGVLAAKFVEKIRKKKIDLRYNQKGSEHMLTNKTLKILKSKKINKVIITDVTVDEGPDQIKKLSRFADILVLDHHRIYNKFNSKKIILIKPQLISLRKINSASYPASKLVYDLSNKIKNMQDLDWIAAAGLIGDASAKHWRPFLNKVFKKYKIKTNKDPFKTRLGQIAVLISSAETYSYSNVKVCYNILYKSKKYQDILKSRLNKYKKIINKELNYWIKNMNRLAEIHKDLNLVMYKVNPKYNIKSPLSTILGLKYPHKTILIISAKRGITRISARRSDMKVPVNDLLENASKGFKNAFAGGHVPSAGAQILTKDYKKFKKRVINLLKNGKKTKKRLF